MLGEKVCGVHYGIYKNASLEMNFSPSDSHGTCYLSRVISSVVHLIRCDGCWMLSSSLEE